MIAGISIDDGVPLTVTELRQITGRVRACRYGQTYGDEKEILRAHDDTPLQAAADRAALLRMIEQQRDALRPFAALLAEHHASLPDDRPIFGINSSTITVGDLRRALKVSHGPR